MRVTASIGRHSTREGYTVQFQYITDEITYVVEYYEPTEESIERNFVDLEIKARLDILTSIEEGNDEE